MSDDQLGAVPPAADPNAPADNAAPMVQLQIHAQYVKDLSSRARTVPLALEGQGGVDISVDVRANAKAENHYEVDLIPSATGKARAPCSCGADYSGLFTLPELLLEHRKAVLDRASAFVPVRLGNHLRCDPGGRFPPADAAAGRLRRPLPAVPGPGRRTLRSGPDAAG